MKRLAIPCALLALLLAGALWNARDLGRIAAPWQAALAAAERAAELGDWTDASASVERISSDWERRHERLHYVIPHARLDEAGCLLVRLQADARSRDAESFRADAAELSARLADLVRSQQLALHSIL